MLFWHSEYLLQTNENATVAKSKKFHELNQALEGGTALSLCILDLH